MNPNENDDEQRERLAEALRLFNEIVMQSELAVYRKYLVSLMARASQTSDVQEIEFQILRDVASHVNEKLAGAADFSPKAANVFASLLKEWEKKRGI